MDLIFCAGRTRRYAEIALDYGFLYGCRSDYRPLFPVVFADVDWKTPNWQRHRRFVQEQCPRYAVAPDVFDVEMLLPTLRYAERLVYDAEVVIVVPKELGLIRRIPDLPWIRLGYSVPTPYGGAPDGLLAEFGQRPTHLLGGSIKQQLRYARLLNVQSVDGNSHMKAASFGSYWTGDKWCGGGGTRGVPEGTPDLPYEAFSLSCANIVASWGDFTLEQKERT